MYNANLVISDYKTGELSFWDFNRPEEGCGLGFAFVTLISIIAWPLIFLTGCLFALGHKGKDLWLAWDQLILKAVQKDDGRLIEYGEEKFEQHKKRLDNLQQKARELVERLGYELAELHEDANFLERFLATDLSQLEEDEETILKPKGQHLCTLKRYQLRLSRLQNESVFWESDENRLEHFRAIAQIALCKIAFRRLEAQEWIDRAILWMIPGGISYSMTTPPNDRERVSQKLLDAHNRLISENDFLLPYINKYSLQDAADHR